MTKQNKKLLVNVLITVLLIAVAKILRLMINDMESLILPTLLIYLRGVIHLSLALVWTVSVYQRITNKQARGFVLTVGILMLFWIVAKTAKYEFFPNNTETLARYLWYCYASHSLERHFRGAVIAIVIGAVLILGAGGFAIFWFVIKKKTWADLFPTKSAETEAATVEETSEVVEEATEAEETTVVEDAPAEEISDEAEASVEDEASAENGEDQA